MKPIIIMVVILVVIIVGGVFSCNYLKSGVQDLKPIIQEIDVGVMNDDWDIAEQKYDDFENEWSGLKGIWTTLMDHNDVYNIELALANLKGAIATKDVNTAKPEIEGLIVSLDHIVEKLKFNLDNIL